MADTPIYNLPYPSDYTEPADVPEAIKDLAEAVEQALDNIDLSAYQVIENLVTSLSSSSTDTQYPSAKCVYDLIGDIDTALDLINGEVVS